VQFVVGQVFKTEPQCEKARQPIQTNRAQSLPRQTPLWGDGVKENDQSKRVQSLLRSRNPHF